MLLILYSPLTFPSNFNFDFFFKKRGGGGGVGRRVAWYCIRRRSSTCSQTSVVTSDKANCNKLKYVRLKMFAVTYFGIPGRGEVVRLMLQIGGMPFEDVLVSSKEWRDLKPDAR